MSCPSVGPVVPKWTAPALLVAAASIVFTMSGPAGSAAAVEPRSAATRSNITGIVTDGSGHGWPLYARVVADGVTNRPVYTDPVTGAFTLALPRNNTYQLRVMPVYSGYTEKRITVPLRATDTTVRVSIPIDAAACVAPGYAVRRDGTSEPFDAGTAPAGWTVTHGTAGGGWQFGDPRDRGNRTGGSGGFAMVDSDAIGPGVVDTTLTAPAVDLTAATMPSVTFDTDYRGYPGQTGRVEQSIDAGATWTVLWEHHDDQVPGPSHVDLPMPGAAGRSGVLVRFRFTATFGFWWEVDNVLIGGRGCDPVPGGLVLGVTTDANNHAALAGVEVASRDRPGTRALSAATPDDPKLGDGFYWLFSPDTGPHPFTATKPGYATLTRTVNVAANRATTANANLRAGRIVAIPARVDQTVAWAGAAVATVTLWNNGSAPATVRLGSQSGGVQPLARTGPPVRRVEGDFSLLSMAAARRSSTAGPGTTRGVAEPAVADPAVAPWTSVADYPSLIQDNVAAVNDGKLYSAFGFNGSSDTSALHVYNPGTGTWTALAAAADTREKASAGFIGGRLYAVGGWDHNGQPDPKLEVYDPVANTWSTAAANPKPHAASGSAVLGGRLYIIGGCGAENCDSTDVQIYNPAADSWTAGAAYPEPTAWLSCGAIGASLYCAGGYADSASIRHVYRYDPGTNSWSPRADMPLELFSSASAVANGKLLLSGGVSGGALTNQGLAYDPAQDAWTALPNSNQATYRGAGGCGFYQLGGSRGGPLGPSAAVQLLPGLADCGGSAGVPWLSTSATSVTVAPHGMARVNVTLDARVAAITQPGDYTARLVLDTDTPYPVAALEVTMTVRPPRTWGPVLRPPPESPPDGRLTPLRAGG